MGTSLTDLFKKRDIIFYILFGVALAAAGAARWWAAPISAGPDVSQFWAFAQVFHTHGIDFYRYAEATADIFPFKLWGYVYPPAWLLILGICLCFVPGVYASESAVDAAWRMAMKTPVIMADLAIGCLIFWAVPGSKARKLLFAALWLFHPTAWYESAVFGQFDAIAAVFLVAALIMLVKHRDWLAFLMAGLAITVKQHTLIPIAGMMAASLNFYRRSELIKKCLVFIMPIIILSIPFLLTGNLVPYAKSVLLPAQAAGYQYPLDYAFSGTGSLLTYLHDVYGWETISIIKSIPYVTGLALAVVIFLCYRRKVNPLQAALASFLVFTALFYRVNYQYMVIFIPVALLVASMTVHRGERLMAIVLALFPAVWMWLFNVSFWFVYLEPPSQWVTPYLASIGMGERSAPEVYVIYAIILTLLSLAYVGLVLSRWCGWEREEGQDTPREVVSRGGLEPPTG
jgi:hypothetical protein